MSEAPVSLAFFDPARGLHGIARAGLTLVFEGARPSAVEQEVTLARRDGGFHAQLAGRLELDFTPVAEEVLLAGARVRTCRVGGELDGRRIDCLGIASETVRAPAWDELDALRSVSAVFDAEHSVVCIARRPRDAPGHGRELVTAALIDGGELRSVEDARLSTVYDGDGRQRSASLELWLPGEDFPRRATGEVTAGTTLELESLLVHASIFRWHMEGREGAGAYELTIRPEPPVAA